MSPEWSWYSVVYHTSPPEAQRPTRRYGAPHDASMLTKVPAGPYTIRGVSVGGVYTSLQVPELGALFDIGIAPRSFAGTDRLFLSHGHADHAGALAALLGIRGLIRKPQPLRVHAPAEIAADLAAAVATQSRMQRHELTYELIPLEPGDETPLSGDLRVRAFRTHHPVPSLGYEVVRRSRKLRPELRHLPGEEIARRRHAGDDLFVEVDRVELAYATDTLVEALDHTPRLYESRVLILECTFLDERKSLQTARAGCHIHLDELIARADRFRNDAVVLMHFSQIYKPAEVFEILDRRCPPPLRARIVPFARPRGDWPG